VWCVHSCAWSANVDSIGSHRHRFDPQTEKGRGLSGRDCISKGAGYGISSPRNANGGVTDLSQLMRTNLHPAEAASERRRATAAMAAEALDKRRRHSILKTGGGRPRPSSPGLVDNSASAIDSTVDESVFDRLHDASSGNGRERADVGERSPEAAWRDSLTKGARRGGGTPSRYVRNGFNGG